MVLCRVRSAFSQTGLWLCVHMHREHPAQKTQFREHWLDMYYKPRVGTVELPTQSCSLPHDIAARSLITSKVCHFHPE